MSKPILKCGGSVTGATVRLDIEGEGSFLFEFVSGEAPPLVTLDFVIWAVLPYAMRRNADIHVQGRVSEQVIRAASKVSNVWEKWLPYHFTRARVTADEVTEETHPATRKLGFYSGGVDSSYSSLKAWREEGERVEALTFHGLDYDHDSDARFEALLAKVKPFADAVFDRHHIVRTDLYDLYDRVGVNLKKGTVSHIFVMSAAATMFADCAEFRIAADIRLDQQYLTTPDGSSLATNRLIRSQNGVMVSLDDDVGRAEKIAYLAGAGADFSCISFCQNRATQPLNCGRCSKCMRTKANFIATGFDIPDMFVDATFGEDWMDALMLSTPAGRVFAGDILAAVEDRGNEGVFPGYHELRRRFVDASDKAEHSLLFQYNYSFREISKQLLPQPVVSAVRLLKRVFRIA